MFAGEFPKMLRFRRKSADNGDMTLDFDLLLAVMLFAEEKCDGRGGIEISPSELPERFHHVNDFVFREHVIDAMKRGYIEGDFTFGKCYLDRLTPAGQKLLEAQRTEMLVKKKQRADTVRQRIKVLLICHRFPILPPL